MNRLLLLPLVAALLCAPVLAAGDPLVRAQLTPRRVAAISAELAGKVRTVHAAEGATFRAGDTLVSFDDALQRAQFERAEAVLAAAEKIYASNRRLHQLNSVGQIELDLSAAEIAKARAELAYATALLARCRIVAPFDGRVAEQRVHDEEFVQAGQPLLELIGNEMPQIDFLAPSKWLAWVRPGQPLAVHIDETSQAYSATVERVSARVDPVSQSVKIVARFDVPSPELIAGMSGTISLEPEVP